MEPTNNLLAHSSLPFYPAITSTMSAGILTASTGGQESASRSALSGQNAWGTYGNETSLVPHNSCSMSSYSNLQLGATFPMNSKPSYTSFGTSAEYLSNCRQMQLNQLGTLNAMPMRNYPIYGDVYQPGHAAGYTNGGFYPEVTPGITAISGREHECRNGPNDSTGQGELAPWSVLETAKMDGQIRGYYIFLYILYIFFNFALLTLLSR